MGEPETAGLEPDPEDNADEGKAVRPQNNDVTKKKILASHALIKKCKQKRKEATEDITAAREKLVTLGIPKKAQLTVEAYLKLNDDDKRFFDEAVAVYRDAIGEPVQGRLELVHDADATAE